MGVAFQRQALPQVVLQDMTELRMVVSSGRGPKQAKADPSCEPPACQLSLLVLDLLY